MWVDLVLVWYLRISWPLYVCCCFPLVALPCLISYVMYARLQPTMVAAVGNSSFTRYGEWVAHMCILVYVCARACVLSLRNTCIYINTALVWCALISSGWTFATCARNWTKTNFCNVTIWYNRRATPPRRLVFEVSLTHLLTYPLTHAVTHSRCSFPVAIDSRSCRD